MSLVDLVSRLAQRHKEAHRVIDRETGIPETVQVDRAPLLDDLEEAVRTSTNRSGNGASKSVIPFDSDVVDLMHTIRGDLTGDLIRLGVHNFSFEEPLKRLLLRWHETFTGDLPSGPETAPWIEDLSEWETRIRAVTEPRKMREVTAPCPICGYTELYVEDERRTMLTITYSEDSPAASIELVCARCEVLAKGASAVATVLKIDRIDATKLI